MGTRSTTTDPGVDLERIRKEQARSRRAPLRIMIATDPNRPIRTISLPRRLPLVVSVVVGTLALATVVLACGSWKLNGALGRLERRMFAMARAADSVALDSAAGRGAAWDGASAQGPAGGVHAPAGALGRFVIQLVNTGEEIEVRVNLATGEVDAECYRQLRHLMRCQRTTAETPVDPRLIDLLYRISQRTHQKILLVSGFRAPMFSLATLSYHTRGMAADIRIPGMTPLMVRDLAMSMGVKGIGYYPVSGFVHVDVRDTFTTWIDYGRDRADTEGAEHGPEHGEKVELEADTAAP
ncbi:MAG TPA: DUF882 domain-containing protein [Polyangia bacterium]|nr:DUF882 domain-containing protein [Polyangia bacterium]